MRVALNLSGFLDRHAPIPVPKLSTILFGLAWFGLLIVASFLKWLLPMTLIVTAVLAALQTSGRAKGAGRPVDQAVAAIGAGAVVAGAWRSTASGGLLLIVFAIVAVLAGAEWRPNAGDTWTAMARAGNTLGCGAPIGLALAAVLMVQRADEAALGFLLVAVCVYDAGCYLISAGESSGRWAGPLAGIAAVVVWVFGMAVFDPPPFSGNQAWYVGLATAVACPLGQWLASALLPRANSSAAALRRVDSWLIAAPVFLVGVWVVS